LLAPAAGLVAAAAAAEPLLAHWTQTFMGSAARFLAQFFPLFLLGALFGKLMEDSGSVSAIAGFMTERLGLARAVVAVVLAGALVTYGGVSLFVAFFVLAPMAQALFRAAAIPQRLIPAAIALGISTMSALPPRQGSAQGVGSKAGRATEARLTVAKGRSALRHDLRFVPVAVERLEQSLGNRLVENIRVALTERFVQARI
jgi:H+/gluconate symporter-like permease